MPSKNYGLVRGELRGLSTETIEEQIQAFTDSLDYEDMYGIDDVFGYTADENILFELKRELSMREGE